MGKFKKAVRVFLWNGMMAAAVFLPGFLLTAWLQVLWMTGVPRRTTFSVEASDWLYIYLLFALPLILASLLYTATLFFIPDRWTPKQRRLAAILIAFILPVVVYLLDLPGGLVYLPFFGPTLIAIILYGMSTRPA